MGKAKGKCRVGVVHVCVLMYTSACVYACIWTSKVDFRCLPIC